MVPMAGYLYLYLYLFTVPYGRYVAARYYQRYITSNTNTNTITAIATTCITP